VIISRYDRKYLLGTDRSEIKPDFHLFFLSFKASFCKQSVGFGEQRSKRRARGENVVKEASNILINVNIKFLK
jgi:hypothetical protein